VDKKKLKSSDQKTDQTSSSSSLPQDKAVEEETLTTSSTTASLPSEKQEAKPPDLSADEKKKDSSQNQQSSNKKIDKPLAEQASFSLSLRIKQILEESGLITKKDLEKAEETAVRRGISLYEVVLDKNLISDNVFGKTIADSIGLSFINLSKITIKDEILKIIPEVIAKKQKIICFEKTKEGLKIALADPTNLEIIEFIKKKTGEKITLYYATKRDIKNILPQYRKEIKEEFSTIIEKSAVRVKGVKGEAVEPPIIKIVDTVISYGNRNKASDIHVEPQEKKAVVRFRIDGLLHDIITVPINIYPQIVTRIKVMSNLRTDEHQKPQDGKITFKENGEKIDIRVSFVPTVEGEKVVMRLLSEQSRQFSLEGLGMGQDDFKKVQRAFKKPYGMILSTGPTGCGKTTTQYVILKILNQRDVNIMTVEDPAEYDIEGVNQIQVNPKSGLSFAAGLRSIVRQDPDIILVGEIRDQETAKIAINSAMTGHLVLSTLHTNDAATSLPRLLDMGIEPFLVASTVTVIIAQRLARKICTRCVKSKEISIEDLKKEISVELLEKHFGNKKTIRVYQGKGCGVCHQIGFSGRIGIFEVLEINGEIRQAIINRVDASKIRELAIKNGMTTMIEDGLKKVAAGATTIEEVLRVIKE